MYIKSREYVICHIRSQKIKIFRFELIDHTDKIDNYWNKNYYFPISQDCI